MDQRQQIIDSHRKLILDLRAIEATIEDQLRRNDPQWHLLEETRGEMQSHVEPLVEAYWKWIPLVTLSQCPFCQQRLRLAFDVYDLTGFWWMDRTQRISPPGEACEHFGLLSGAVNLNGRPVKGGLFECRPGPDKPYVIPRILGLPYMQAVISAIPMHCGYTAYPIAYFAEHPPKVRIFTQSWARKEYTFTLPDGRSGWDITRESRDYDLKRWAKTNKIAVWQNDQLTCLDNNHSILTLPGQAREQVIFENSLSFETFQ